MPFKSILIFNFKRFYYLSHWFNIIVLKSPKIFIIWFSCCSPFEMVLFVLDIFPPLHSCKWGQLAHRDEHFAMCYIGLATFRFVLLNYFRLSFSMRYYSHFLCVIGTWKLKTTLLQLMLVQIVGIVQLTHKHYVLILIMRKIRVESLRFY